MATLRGCLAGWGACCAMVAWAAWAEVPSAAVFSGEVRSRGTRRPIPGAAVRVGTEWAADSDARGRFRIELPAGLYAVEVSAPGHLARQFVEKLGPGQRREVLYRLEPVQVNPYETVVRDLRERPEASRITLRDRELHEVPGTLGDPFRVVMLLPGVGAVVSGVSYPVVRGAEPAATGFFIDGVRVPLLFHLFLGPAVVHPDFVDAIDFYPGSPPPQYGRLLGGVIDGHLSRPREDRVHANVYADFINAGLFVDAPVKPTGTRATLAGRLSYTPLLVATAVNALAPPAPAGSVSPSLVLDFYDYQGRLEQQVGQGKLRLFAFGSSDVFGTRHPDGNVPAAGGSAEEAILFHRADARFTQPLGAGEGELGFTWGLDRVGFQSQTQANQQLSSIGLNLDERTLSGRAKVSAPVEPGVRLMLGGDVEHHQAAVGIRQNQAGLSIQSERPLAVATYVGGWFQAVWERELGWSVVPGLRIDGYHLVPGIDDLAVEPRLTVRRVLGNDLTWKAAAGVFHQPPTTLISLPVVDLASLRYGLQQAAQVSTGLEWRPPRGLEMTAEAYLSPLFRTLEFDLINTLASDVSGGANLVRGEAHGYAWGFEVLVRRPLGGNWFGWLSYSLSQSLRHAQFNRYDAHGDVVATDTRYVPFAFDQTHLANAVLSYKLGSHFTVGTVLHFNSGRPETGALGQEAQTAGTDLAGNPQWVPVDRDRSPRLPPFFRVDARVSYAHAYDDFSLEAYLDFLNVTLSSEVLAYSYQTRLEGTEVLLTKQAQGWPIAAPIFGLKASY